MKKFIAIAVAAAVASMTQATQVTWSSGSLRQAKQAQSDITGITAYYFAITGASAAEVAENYAAVSSLSQKALYYTYFNEDGTLKEGKTPSNSTVDAETGVTTYGTQANAFGVANWTQDNPDTDSGNTAYVVAIYQAKSEYGGTYALASVATATFESGDVLENFDDPSGGTFSGIGTAAYTNGGGWTAVPEPTTVALLALGLAAVGLKRKVA